MWHNLIKKFRIFKYSLLSEKAHIDGMPLLHQPILYKGSGNISFGEDVQIGVYSSPNFYNTYAYIEARSKDSEIIFQNNIHINNNFSATALGAKIILENNLRIGSNCSIVTSDFHFLEPSQRNELNPTGKNVIIKNNVFIGNNVTILKGVTIGENSVIGSGAIVSSNIPANCVAVGNPAKVIRELKSNT